MLIFLSDFLEHNDLISRLNEILCCLNQISQLNKRHNKSFNRDIMLFHFFFFFFDFVLISFLINKGKKMSIRSEVS